MALAIDGEVRASSAVEQARSSVELLQRIDFCLRECDLRPGDLDALVVLRGPGSFTGLRVGLATAQGLCAALGVEVAVLPSLRVLAAHAWERLESGESASTLVSAIDALRGEWFAQPHRATAPGRVPEPVAAAAIVPVSRLAGWAPGTLVGFGVERLAAAEGLADGLAGLRILEAGPLAPTAARLAPLLPECWNAELLTDPLYLREPAVTLPLA